MKKVKKTAHKKVASPKKKSNLISRFIALVSIFSVFLIAVAFVAGAYYSAHPESHVLGAATHLNGKEVAMLWIGNDGGGSSEPAVIPLKIYLRLSTGKSKNLGSGASACLKITKVSGPSSNNNGTSYRTTQCKQSFPNPITFYAKAGDSVKFDFSYNVYGVNKSTYYAHSLQLSNISTSTCAGNNASKCTISVYSR